MRRAASGGWWPGSSNYTKAAEEKNGQDVLVNWNNPKLAEVYLKDWKKHWDHSDPVAARS